MEAKELMIGDWVMSTLGSHQPVKVYAIGNNFIDLRYGEIKQSGILALCDFEPIPLTEEILKANGFEIFFVSKVCAARIYQTLELYDWDHCNKWYTNIGRTNVSYT